MADAASLSSQIAVLESRLTAFAGIRSTTMGDQSTTFDYDWGIKELARLRNELATVTATTTGTSRTRYAVTSKGFNRVGGSSFRRNCCY